jgi:hypothetical protein
MTLIYNNDEFAAIIISVYIYTYNVMNIDINIVKQLFEVYISRNSKKENIILINKFGFLCDINKDNNYYKEYAYKILEENMLTCVLDKLKLIQNLKLIINNINDTNDIIDINDILMQMATYKNDIKYYCNRHIYINYITEIEYNCEKIISNDNENDINEIKKNLINIIDKTIVSTYNLDYTIK